MFPYTPSIIKYATISLSNKDELDTVNPVGDVPDIETEAFGIRFVCFVRNIIELLFIDVFEIDIDPPTKLNVPIELFVDFDIDILPSIYVLPFKLTLPVPSIYILLFPDPSPIITEFVIPLVTTILDPIIVLLLFDELE